MDLIPSTSASAGITWSQNLARDVAQRIDALRGRAARSRVAAWTGVAVPGLASVALAVTELWPFAVVIGYCALFVSPAAIAVHLPRRRALRHAERLDRERDVAWVSATDGLVFFGDGGVFLERRGGFKPYGVGPRRFASVEHVGDLLMLHGRDSENGATYRLDVAVPDGWNDDDTARVARKLAAFDPRT